MLSILFKSYLIKHSGTGRAIENTQGSQTFKALRELSESTQRALKHSSIWRALGHSEGTWTHRALRFLGTWALKVLRHLGT